MAQIVRNAQALGAALEKHGIPVLGAHEGYTHTHQTTAPVRPSTSAAFRAPCLAARRCAAT
jgi:glycine/serine hydroxymethyltransferase